MKAEERKTILDRHYNLYQLYLKDRYLPAGSYSALAELDLVSQSIGNRPTALHCSACVDELLRRVYFAYNIVKRPPTISVQIKI